MVYAHLLRPRRSVLFRRRRHFSDYKLILIPGLSSSRAKNPKHRRRTKQQRFLHHRDKIRSKRPVGAPTYSENQTFRMVCALHSPRFMAGINQLSRHNFLLVLHLWVVFASPSSSILLLLVLLYSNLVISLFLPAVVVVTWSMVRVMPTNPTKPLARPRW